MTMVMMRMILCASVAEGVGVGVGVVWCGVGRGVCGREEGR